MKRGAPPLRAHAPSFVVFSISISISIILALVAVLMHDAHVSIPIVGTSHVFDTLVAAYVVMLIGVLFKGV